MAGIDPDLLSGIRAAMGGANSSGNDSTDTITLTSLGIPMGNDPVAYNPDSFYQKWAPLTEGLDRPFHLLVSPREDDFSGAIIVEDDYYLGEFLDDLMRLLVTVGKIKSDKAIARIGSVPLAQRVVRSIIDDPSKERETISTGGLCVIEGLGQYPPAYFGMPAQSFDESHSRIFANVLGRIVDGRYVLLCGTSDEVEGFIRRYPVLAPTFGESIIRLRGMSPDGVFEKYCENLNDELRKKVTEDFKARFKDYVEFNSDSLTFKGAELADRLAKVANGAQELVLPEDRFTSTSLDSMFERIVGLEKVKEAIRGLESYVTFMKRAEGHGSRVTHGNLHMVFEGNPGTGKTMVARLVAQMLHSIGIVRSSKCVETSARDLTAEYVGQTDKLVAEKVREAMGGVLFIDEAYGLMPQGEASVGYGAEAITELVKSMEDYKDDLVVILAGYEKEMQGLIDSNPGISSRIGYTFHFDDYSVGELMQIFRLEADRRDLSIGDGVEGELSRLFAYFSRFKSFGNGRFVEKVLQKALTNHAVNRKGETANTSVDYLTITVEDIPSRQDMFGEFGWEARPAKELLEPLVGLGAIKEEVLALERTVSYREVALRAGVKVPELNLNMVFRGNPGTGKTTVARIVAAVLYNIGAVPSNHFEEIEAKDLMSSTVGGVAKETSKAIERALGGVLFLDEAYALTDGPAGREALAVLVKAMEDHKGELVIMFAGYTAEMRAFIDENPGLASRVGYTFDFKDYEADDLLEIFHRKMSACGFDLAEGVSEGARDAFRYFHSVENFGNGRFVDRYIQTVIATHAGCFLPENPGLITTESLPTIKHLCEISATDVLDCTDDEEAAALRRVAVHEAGHAVCRLASTGDTDVVLITVEHEGNGALGYVQHKNVGISLPTARNLRDELVCLLGGMSAEEAYFGSYSAGNSSDLEKATQLACRYVATYGMSDAGLIQFARKGFDYSNLSDLPAEVLAAMRGVLDESHVEAKARVKRCRGAIDAIVAELETKATISGEELLRIWEANKPRESHLADSVE